MLNLICPECKNKINVPDTSEIKEGSIIECDTCGITLEVSGIDGDNVNLEVIDEGK
ncbi:hypothetical protein J7L24_01195 [bacterium]|nr:hypothetical protein [bacterium]